METNNSLEEMGAFFNCRAEIYDEKHLEHINGGFTSKKVIASFLPEGTRTLLDIGIGTGLELEEIFKRFPYIEVTGLDVAENMLSLVRTKYPNNIIKLYNADCFSFDFGYCMYDVALSVMTLHHYNREDKMGLYRRLHSALKPGGMYIEGDYMITRPDGEGAQEIERFNFSELERLKREQGISDDKIYHYDTPCTVEHQKEMLFLSGFKSIHEVWRAENNIILVAGK